MCVHLGHAGGIERTAGGPVSIMMGSEAVAHPCGVAPHTAHIVEEMGDLRGRVGTQEVGTWIGLTERVVCMDSNQLPHGRWDRNGAWGLGTWGNWS